MGATSQWATSDERRKVCLKTRQVWEVRSYIRTYVERGFCSRSRIHASNWVVFFPWPRSKDPTVGFSAAKLVYLRYVGGCGWGEATICGMTDYCSKIVRLGCERSFSRMAYLIIPLLLGCFYEDDCGGLAGILCWMKVRNRYSILIDSRSSAYLTA